MFLSVYVHLNVGDCACANGRIVASVFLCMQFTAVRRIRMSLFEHAKVRLC